MVSELGESLMKNKNTYLLIAISLLLFLVACDKNENAIVYDTISGMLIAGENVSLEELSESNIILAKLDESVDPLLVTTETDQMELMGYADIDTDGSFDFSNLGPGHYVLFFEEKFILSPDTLAIANIGSVDQSDLKFVVDRIIPDNSDDVTYVEFYYSNKATFDQHGQYFFSASSPENPNPVLYPSFKTMRAFKIFELRCRFFFSNNEMNAQTSSIDFPSLFHNKKAEAVFENGEKIYINFERKVSFKKKYNIFFSDTPI